MLATEVAASAATDNQTNDEIDDVDEVEDEDETDDDEDTDDEAVTPAVARVDPIPMPPLDPAPIQPMFAGLASIISAKGTLLLAIAKLANGDLRVTAAAAGRG